MTGGESGVDGLRRDHLREDPVDLFLAWLADARERSGMVLPEAACLSTVGPDGYPEGRVVLLKEADARGFVFYTNLQSPKVVSLDREPRAALTFHWEALERQVRVQGTAERVSAEEADAYFRTRPRGSQLGAWASDQSRPVPDRESLEARFRETEARYEGGEVPRPAHWGGLRLRPERVEFWQGRPNRLHDRFRYERTDGGWRIERLSP